MRSIIKIGNYSKQSTYAIISSIGEKHEFSRITTNSIIRGKSSVV
jgi:hypothetical protein